MIDPKQKPCSNRAIITPTLLYGAETWLLYWKQIRPLHEQFHQCCLCSSLDIKWQDYMSHEEVLKSASLPSIAPSCFRCSCTGVTTSQGWKTYACQKLSSSASFEKESVIVGEETAWAGWNKPTVMAAGGLRPRQLVLISVKSQF